MRNLVIAPAGGRSLHREWMGTPGVRSYDVWLNCYESGTRFDGDPVRILDARGTLKWQGMTRLLAEHGDEVLAYDAVWFPDDDVSIAAAEVDRLFQAFHALDLWLAQPALGDGSYYSHPITLANGSFTARYTNFVEVMAPIFSRSALRACGPSFGGSVSGWGLDRVWPRILGAPRDRIAILDAVPMVHAHPVGGGSWYASLPVPPKEEEARVAARYGLAPPFRIFQFGGVPREAGTRREAAIPSDLRFLWRIARGAPRSQWMNGKFWRRHWKSARGGARSAPARATAS